MLMCCKSVRGERRMENRSGLDKNNDFFSEKIK